ncbi:MAG: hypothetical protein M0P61_14380 [Ignavibacteriaceae bacterium]|jgi:hypothetical protein|nr:hypothetical protein [Ignavibacteriaceae bacterium]
MKYLFPDNLFARFFAFSFSEEEKKQISFLPSAQITAALEKETDAIGLIPTLDLLKHEELFISKLGGVSFESEFCNSYFYYPSKGNQEKVTEIALSGDVSSLEAILCKILFAELYDQEVKILLKTNQDTETPLLLVGDTNLTNVPPYAGLNGISFADEVIEILSAPFVNYIFAAKGKETVIEFNNKFTLLIPKYYESILPFISSLDFSDELKEKIKQEFSSFVFEFDSMDIDGIAQLTRLPYYHGIIKEIIDIKFV